MLDDVTPKYKSCIRRLRPLMGSAPSSSGAKQAGASGKFASRQDTSPVTTSAPARISQNASESKLDQVSLDEALARELQAQVYQSADHSSASSDAIKVIDRVAAGSGSSSMSADVGGVDARVWRMTQHAAAGALDVLKRRDVQVTDVKSRHFGESPFCYGLLQPVAGFETHQETKDGNKSMFQVAVASVKARPVLQVSYLFDSLNPVVDWSDARVRAAVHRSMSDKGILVLLNHAASKLGQGLLGIVFARRSAVEFLGSEMRWPDHCVPMDGEFSGASSAGAGADVGAGSSARTTATAGITATSDFGTFAALPMSDTAAESASNAVSAAESSDSAACVAATGECPVCRLSLLTRRPLAMIPCGHMICSPCECKLADRKVCFVCRKSCKPMVVYAM